MQGNIHVPNDSELCLQYFYCRLLFYDYSKKAAPLIRFDFENGNSKQQQEKIKMGKMRRM